MVLCYSTFTNLHLDTDKKMYKDSFYTGQYKGLSDAWQYLYEACDMVSLFLVMRAD